MLADFFNKLFKSGSSDLDPRWLSVKKKLQGSKRIIDLGCGNNPVKGASVGVDYHLGPKERLSGRGPLIDAQALAARGIQFVHARIDQPLPFGDKEFDFAYSHHAFEHLEDPGMACREMMRIARSGAVITPSFFAEYIFGRSYHRWLVMDRGKGLFFFKKRPFEQMPFGKTPNSFDMLLNDEDWYKGQEGQMPKLSEILRKHWYNHSPLMEVIFLWEHEFDFKVIE